MHVQIHKRTLAAAGIGCLLLAGPVLARQARLDPARPRLDAAVLKKGKPIAGLKTHTCDHIGSIACGQTVNDSLTPPDCELDDGSFLDFWEFQGTAGQTVTIDMTSSQVDSFLFLLNPEPMTVATDDDRGPGVNARIVFQLDSSGTWTIGANTATGGETGSYTLSLACSTPGGGPPAAPTNLRATAVSPTEVDLDWNDNSNNEAEFRVEGRTGNGSFLDLGGVGANVTGATVENLQPETEYTFRVRARNAVGDFSPYSNSVTVTTPGEDAPDGFLTTPAFPDFRFRVQIFQQADQSLLGRKENDCIPETLCVSGAVRGRSEVFLRIIGPRPNGFLWPTLVRFTPSRVMVEIEQLSTAIVKVYELPAVPPDVPELSGLQDRTGFQP
jgi:hypothetical protein